MGGGGGETIYNGAWVAAGLPEMPTHSCTTCIYHQISGSNSTRIISSSNNTGEQFDQTVLNC